MVQRTFTVRLSVYAARKLTAMVEGKSKSAEEIAAIMLESHLFDPADFTWINGDPRDPQPPYDPDEPGRDLDEVMAELREELERRLAAKSPGASDEDQ